MNKNGNTYTFIYASVMVIIVAALLSIAATVLKPRQTNNMNIEKMQNILASVNINVSAGEAEAVYNKRITKSYVVNSKGEEIQGDAFSIDLKNEKAKPLEQRALPVFECNTDDGIKYIFPMRGAGLWGPIWGYVALNDDLNTIYGANFSHEGETPGLGAEIATPAFQDMFKGKTIFDASGNLVSIIVAKSNENAPAEHRVDGISGGTITSKGLQQMLLDDFQSYKNFIIRKKS